MIPAWGRTFLFLLELAAAAAVAVAAAAIAVAAVAVAAVAVAVAVAAVAVAPLDFGGRKRSGAFDAVWPTAKDIEDVQNLHHGLH